MILNDFSARDVQLAEMQSAFGPQKSKHFVNAISAAVVTMENGHRLRRGDEIQRRIDRIGTLTNRIAGSADAQ